MANGKREGGSDEVDRGPKSGQDVAQEGKRGRLDQTHGHGHDTVRRCIFNRQERRTPSHAQ